MSVVTSYDGNDNNADKDTHNTMNMAAEVINGVIHKPTEDPEKKVQTNTMWPLEILCLNM